MRLRSSAYSYCNVYSSETGPDSNTKWTWLAYPSSYSSTTSIDFTAATHSGYRAKSAMTAATRSAGAAMTIDCVEVSVMRGRLPLPRGTRPVGSPPSGVDGTGRGGVRQATGRFRIRETELEM